MFKPRVGKVNYVTVDFYCNYQFLIIINKILLFLIFFFFKKQGVQMTFFGMVCVTVLYICIVFEKDKNKGPTCLVRWA